MTYKGQIKMHQMKPSKSNLRTLERSIKILDEKIERLEFDLENGYVSEIAAETLRRNYKMVSEYLDSL